MNLLEWLPTVITILIWIGIFCCRHWLKIKITASIQHEFNSKLEHLKSELRSRESELSTLRDVVFTGQNQRQALIDKRKIEAVENIWKSVVELQRFEPLAGIMTRINLKYAVAESPTDPKVRKFFEEINRLAPKVENLKLSSVENERLFISPVVWAYFSALQAILLCAFARAKMLEVGMKDVDKLMNTGYEKKLLKIALPHQEAYIDEYDVTAHYYLLEELKEKLLMELNNSLDGKASDQQSLQRAADIQKEIERMHAEKLTAKIPS